MYFSLRSSSSSSSSLLYVFVSLLCVFSSFLLFALDCVSCAAILVDPNDLTIPRTTDFAQCSAPTSCYGAYYCANTQATCYLRECRYQPPRAWRGVTWPDGTHAPACVETYTGSKLTLTVAIGKQESPSQVMTTTAVACDDVSRQMVISSQMVILSIATSTKTVVDIINSVDPSLISRAKIYTAYDIQLFFFYEDDPDNKRAEDAASIFKTKLHGDSSAIVGTLSVGGGTGTGTGRAAAIFSNTSDWKITPATFSIQRCQDGTAVTGEETCPVAAADVDVDPALVATAGTASTKTTTSRLLTIILPIVGGVVFIALIIAAIFVVRRRRAKKEQTEKHTKAQAEAEAEAAVDVTKA